MSVLKNIKNTPRSPPIGRQALSVFFLQICNEVPKKKGACRPPPRATGVSPYKSSNPPFPSSFEPENSTKNPEKKREVRRREAAEPCRI